MPRIGVQVTDLGPGKAVVSRHGGPYRVTGAGKDTWLLRPTGDAARSEAGQDEAVRLGEPAPCFSWTPRRAGTSARHSPGSRQS